MKKNCEKKYFFYDWPLLKDMFEKRNLSLFLDYDGTLTPIADRPENACLENKTKQLLERLASLDDCQVAIVSGRALKDVRQRVNLKKIIYVGNHGFEILGPHIYFENSYFPTSRNIFEKIIKALHVKLRDMKGIILEDKGATFSIHYRLVEEKNISLFEKVLQGILQPYLKLNEIRVRRGKKVYEIRPPVEWDKGKAVLWLLKEQQRILEDKKHMALYIGDDETDEDAFNVLRDKAVTIRVGLSMESKAKYYFHDVKEVQELLRRILLLKK